MITLTPGNLNILIGKIGHGKTPLAINIANTELHAGKNVLYITTDVDSMNIKRSIHCLYNDVNFVHVKYAKDEKTPLNLELPVNLTVIDKVETIDGIYKAYEDVIKTSHIDLVIVDNINFIKDSNEKDYKDRLDFINMTLQEFAIKNSVTFLCTINLLHVIDGEPIDFMFKDMGKFILINRKDTKCFEITVDNDIANKKMISLSFKNLKMGEMDLSAAHQLEED